MPFTKSVQVSLRIGIFFSFFIFLFLSTAYSAHAATIFTDTFTDASGTPLESHTGETGTWTKTNGPSTSAINISSAGRLYNAGGDVSAYTANVTPSTNQYIAQADFVLLGASNYASLGVRMTLSSSSVSGYVAGWDVNSSDWKIYKIVNNTVTILSSSPSLTLSAGHVYHVKLNVFNSPVHPTIRLTVDGNTVAVYTDFSNTFTNTGSAGVYFFGTASDTQGLQIDNFSVYESSTTPPTVSFSGATPADNTIVASTSIPVSLSTNASGDYYSFLDLDRSLLGWWTGDNTASDTSSYANNGVWTGNQGNTLGKFNNGFSFDGSSKVVASDSGFPTGSQPRSFFSWIKTNSSNANQVISSYGDGSGGGTGYLSAFVISNGGDHLYFQGDFDDVSVAVPALNDNNWHHVGYVYNGGTSITFYDDNVAYPATLGTVPNTHTSGNFSIGGYHVANDSEFVGVIDESLFFNRALSVAEISSLYDGQVNPLAVTLTNLAKGTHTIRGYSVDTAGGISSTTSKTIILTATSSPRIISGTVDGNNITLSFDQNIQANNPSLYNFLFHIAIPGNGVAGEFAGSIRADSSTTLSFVLGTHSLSTYSLSVTYSGQNSPNVINVGGDIMATQDANITNITVGVPTVSTLQATSIGQISATLSGGITALGDDVATTVGFIYGPTLSYGATSSSVGTFSTGSFNRSVGGLSCNALYHYKAYATNVTGTSYGSDQTFITTSCANVAVVASQAGGSASADQLAAILAPSPAATRYLNSLRTKELLSSRISTSPISASTVTDQNTRSFTRDLYFNSYGTDVTMLQKYLNTHGFIVSPFGSGSLGHETNHFGPATKAALIAFQKANHIVPAVGYFGSTTRNAIANKK